LDGRITVMRIVRDRTEAIAVACAMREEGIEVTGVGPMLDTGQQEIELPSLREICRRRRRCDNRISNGQRFLGPGSSGEGRFG
jgi:hypothetical protein